MPEAFTPKVWISNGEAVKEAIATFKTKADASLASSSDMGALNAEAGGTIFDTALMMLLPSLFSRVGETIAGITTLGEGEGDDLIWTGDNYEIVEVTNEGDAEQPGNDVPAAS